MGLSRVDISQGVDPIPGSYDLIERTWDFRVGSESFKFHEPLPFTLKDWKADKGLILKHGG